MSTIAVTGATGFIGSALTARLTADGHTVRRITRSPRAAGDVRWDPERALLDPAALDGVEAHAAYGDPAEELTLYSASLDLLVLGSRSYGPLGRLVHGSTAHQLAGTARCPLLVLARNPQTTSPAGSADDRATASPAA